MDQQQQSCSRPTKRQLLWAVGIAAVLTVAVLIAYRYDITLWDWIKLLIVPAVIAGGGFWFNRQQRERELEIARQQREQELGIAERRTQDEALQAYLDQMSGMLIPSQDQPSLYKARPGDSLSSVARARTLTVLPRLDGDRKARVVKFLYEAGLIVKGRPVLDLSRVDLTGANLNLMPRADLSYADLQGANLSYANLGGAYLTGANLSYANLREANLRRVYLEQADLSHADLSYANLQGAALGGADLSGADLRGADLSWADLRWPDLGSEVRSLVANLSGADLSNAYLREANLSHADLKEANLSGADLSHANLRGAVLRREFDLSDVEQWKEEQRLAQAAKSLIGATMPNGQKYED